MDKGLAGKGRRGHLAWMAVALGFMAGAKTTGLLYAGLLSLVTLWELRSSGALALRSLGCVISISHVII